MEIKYAEKPENGQIMRENMYWIECWLQQKNFVIIRVILRRNDCFRGLAIMI